MSGDSRASAALTPANSTTAETIEQLRRDYLLALSDVLKGDSKASAATLDVIRRTLCDWDQARQWEAEQAHRSPDTQPPSPTSALGFDPGRLPYGGPPIGATYTDH